MVSNSFINKPSWKHIECFLHCFGDVIPLGGATIEIV